jgi:hypothetical protein
MTAIETCRTAALGGHVEQCDACGHQRIAYNSCANRHCPKCQSLARVAWIECRRAEILDCEYFHVVFTVPDDVAVIAAQNKAQVTASSFARPLKPYAPSRPTRSISARRSGSSPCCTPGGRRWCIIRICTVSSRGAACRPMAPDGWRVTKSAGASAPHEQQRPSAGSFGELEELGFRQFGEAQLMRVNCECAHHVRPPRSSPAEFELVTREYGLRMPTRRGGRIRPCPRRIRLA